MNAVQSDLLLVRYENSRRKIDFVTHNDEIEMSVF